MATQPENSTLASPHTIVVGSGPVGVRFVTELLERAPESRVTLFGEEQVNPYNRVQLSSLLAGKIAIDDIELPIPAQSDRFSFIPSKVTDINLRLKRVIDDTGAELNFDRLVLATGARAHIPNIDGLDQRGVFTFRSLKDAEALYARTSRAQHIIIVGGGLLGIETARALMKNNTRVTLVQQGDRLMNKQLDQEAASILTRHLEEIGVRVITNAGVRKILGEGRVTGVLLRNHLQIDCDTVVFCSGIAPNLDLARAARLQVNRGIVVNDQLKTSYESIYAIGECCEYQEQIYGVVSPGYEQAAVLAELLSETDIADGEAPRYVGSLMTTSLKIVETPVYSFGEVVNYRRTPFHKELVFRRKNKYVKMVCHQGALIGGLAVGEWPESNRVLELFNQRKRTTFWQRLCFRFSGKFWPFSESTDVAAWPATSIVCQCRHVTQGALCKSIASGACNVASISSQTGAASVCGSCKPLIQELLAANSTEPVVREKEWAWPSMLIASLAVFAVVFTVLLTPGIAVSNSVTTPALLESVWNDKFWKQVTGFTLLGMTALGLLMSMRKRIQSASLTKLLGKFAYWRFMHISIGLACAVTLMLHTGLHMGDNLNRWLMLNFLTVLSLGSLAGLVVALSHRLAPIKAQRTVKLWSWLHILVTWPLPILLATHVLTVYYF